MELLHGRRVLLTGASGAMGRPLSEALLALGAEVVAVARRRTALIDLMSALDNHERLNVADADLSDVAGLSALFDSVERRAPLDVVVHAAGAFERGPFIAQRPEAIERALRDNASTAGLVLREAARRMATRGEGRIVLFAADDLSAREPLPAPFAAAKAAVIALSHSVALEMAPHGVAVNVVAPADIESEANRVDPEGPGGGWVDPRQVAEVVTYLAAQAPIGLSGSILRFPLRTKRTPGG